MQKSEATRRAVVTGALLVSTAVAGSIVSVGAAIGVERDPVYAAIERQRAAYAAVDAHCKSEPRGMSRDPGYPEWARNMDRLGDALADAERALVATVPATMAGAAAFASFCAETYLGEDEYTT